MTNKPLAILTDFEIVRPAFERTQPELLEWLANMHARAEASLTGSNEINSELHSRFMKLFKRLDSSDHIGSRGADIPDGQSLDHTKMEIYRIESRDSDTLTTVERGPYGAGMDKRTRYFAHTAENVFEKFYPVDSSPPSHLIHATCTGYSAPSAAQKIVNTRQWSGLTSVTHAYHMGCYASLPAIRLGSALVSTSEKKTDIVHTEMCSLHMNPLDHSLEHMVVCSLFADGHVKYSVEHKIETKPGFEVYAIKEAIVPDSASDMAWSTSDWGMRMTLSKSVPDKIAENLKAFLNTLLSEWEPDLRKTAIFAIHPGGPKIIDSIQSLLDLSDEQVAHSKDILNRYGNMSSATLPHIWKSIVEDAGITDGKEVISLAFGPGLTIFGARMRKRIP